MFKFTHIIHIPCLGLILILYNRQQQTSHYIAYSVHRIFIPYTLHSKAMSDNTTLIDRASSSSTKPPPLCRHDYESCPHIATKLPSRDHNESEYRRQLRSTGKFCLFSRWPARKLNSRYSQEVWGRGQVGSDRGDTRSKATTSKLILPLCGHLQLRGWTGADIKGSSTQMREL